MLKLTFNIYTVPQTFYIIDGMAYEMQALSIFYDNIRAFIKGNYLNDTKVYEKWPLPTYVVDWTTMHLVYAYRDGLKYYNKNQYDLWEFCNTYKLNEFPQYKQFFDAGVKTQYHILIALAMFVLLVLFITMRALLCFLCCRKKVPVLVKESNSAPKPKLE